MGNANSNQKKETVDWDKINTDSFSSNLPSLESMSKDTKELIEKLNISDNIKYEETESENSNIFAWLKNNNNEIGDEFNQISDLINNVKDLEVKPINESNIKSETSPFISSEDYENLVNEKTSSENINEENTHANQKGGSRIADTSTTSIGSVTKLSRNEVNLDSDDSNLSYLSSSAHTEGVNKINSDVEESESYVEEKINDDYESSPGSDQINIDNSSESNAEEELISNIDSFSESEIEQSTISPVDNKLISSEINTSDINMLSSDDN